MDSFAEQLLKKKNSTKEYAIIALIIVAFLLINGAVMILFPPLMFLVAVGTAWGAWWLIQTQYIEYEYSVLNGDLDIDCITGKRKRKRVVQVRSKKIDDLLPVTQNLNLQGFQRVLYACTSKETATFYVTYQSKKFGRTIVLMEPNGRVFKELFAGQPRNKQLATERACREAGVEMPKPEDVVY